MSATLVINVDPKTGIASVKGFQKEFAGAMKGSEKAGIGLAKGLETLANGIKVTKAAFTLAWKAGQKLVDVTWHLAQQTAAADASLARVALVANTSTEQISKLSFAVSQYGANQDDLLDGLKDFAVRMQEAADGAGTGHEFLTRLGITVTDTDGRLRPVVEVFKEFSDKLAGMTDATEAAVVADELLNDVGIRLLPTLRQGAEGIERLGEDAENLGVVVDESSVKMSQKFNKNLKSAAQLVKGLWERLGRELIPHFNEAVEHAILLGKALIEDIKWKEVQSAISLVAETLWTFGTAFYDVSDAVQKFATVVVLGTIESLSSLGEGVLWVADKLSGLAEAFGVNQELNREWITEQQKQIDGFRKSGEWVAFVSEEFSKLDDKMKGATIRAGDLSKRMGNAGDVARTELAPGLDKAGDEAEDMEEEIFDAAMTVKKHFSDEGAGGEGGGTVPDALKDTEKGIKRVARQWYAFGEQAEEAANKAKMGGKVELPAE